MTASPAATTLGSNVPTTSASRRVGTLRFAHRWLIIGGAARARPGDRALPGHRQSGTAGASTHDRRLPARRLTAAGPISQQRW
jgi:hypothetical protein